MPRIPSPREGKDILDQSGRDSENVAGRSTAKLARRLALLAITALLALSAPGAPVATVCALEDGRIGVLYVGCIARSRPFWDMRHDPLFAINFVQATYRSSGAYAPVQQASGGGEVSRMVRLYMPRTYSQVASGFDVIVLANANRFAVGPGNIEMLARAVREGGLGLYMSGGWEGFGGHNHPSWGSTSIGELLPTVDVEESWVSHPRGGLRLVITDSDHEFVRSLPWERERAHFMSDLHHNIVTTKEGSRLLAVIRYPGQEDPGMVTWELAAGNRVFALTGQTHVMAVGPWTYYLDFGANLMIHLDGRPVPQDIDLVHSLRTTMQAVATRRSLLMSLLEFCDSFGANTDRIMLRINGLNDRAAEATPLYLQLQFQETLDAYRAIEGEMASIEGDAMRLKDRTLLWVYLIEWLAVTGVGMMCGFVLWSTMVRRRLYRDVKTTRLEVREDAWTDHWA